MHESPDPSRESEQEFSPNAIVIHCARHEHLDDAIAPWLPCYQNQLFVNTTRVLYSQKLTFFTPFPLVCNSYWVWRVYIVQIYPGVKL